MITNPVVKQTAPVKIVRKIEKAANAAFSILKRWIYILAFRELFTTTRFAEADFFTLNFTGIACYEASVW